MRVLRRILGALSSTAIFACACGAAAAQTTSHVVKDPHYGDGLFHFFQDHHFTALTGLMVSQHFDRVPRHADEAEVLRGGLLLSYGLHHEAGAIFTALIERGATPAVRDRAWFYLAKIRYQRGLVDEAHDAIGKVGDRLPPELADERVLLGANILMARADYAGAAELLARPAPRGGASAYARFNLGVALVKSGQPAKGSALLDQLGRESADDEEMRSLRDKANLALGFTALQEKQPALARTYLERMRLAGLHANKALLGFGWAAASLDQPKLALVPWTELSRRDPADSAVLEARIAVPHAYAQLGAWRQALEQYNQALGAFEREDRALDESIAAVGSGRLVAGLVDHNPGEAMGWAAPIRELPTMPHAGHLSQLLAQHPFQEAFKNYRDLLFLARNLEEWQDKLGVYDDMLANRRRAYAERLPEVRAKARSAGITELEQRRDALAAELARASAAADGMAFADAHELELLARLRNVHEALAQAGRDPAFDAARERARLAGGVLAWRLATEQPARAWEVKKAFKAIDEGLADARRRDAAITAAQRDEPARFDRYAARTAALAQRLRALQPQVTTLAQQQQQALQALAVELLQAQKERLAGYTVQARYAVAQIYDRATAAREADHAAAH